MKEYAFYYTEYHKSLVYFAYTMVKDNATAEDCVMDVWQTVIEKDSLSDRSKGFDRNIQKIFAGYLYVSVKNRCINHILSENRKSEIREQLDIDSIERDCFGLIVKAETARLMHKAVSTLPEGCKEVIKLYYWGGHNTTEIAKMLGLRTSTIKGQKNRAESLIKQIMNEDCFLLPKQKREKVNWEEAIQMTLTKTNSEIAAIFKMPVHDFTAGINRYKRTHAV